jgi:hypothetical protein
MRGLGELDQDGVVVGGQAVGLELALQLVHQQPADFEMGTPEPLLFGGEPGGVRVGGVFGAGVHGSHDTCLS